MKIAYFGNFGTSWDGSICDEKHISDGFKELGIDVIEIQRETAKDATIGDVDFILISQWYGYPEHFAKTLKEKTGKPVIYWAFDYQYKAKEKWHLDMAKEADLFLSPEIAHQDFYKELGANFYWVSQELVHSSLDKKEAGKKYDVVFTGSYVDYGKFRIELLKEIDKYYDLHIFSYTENEWKNAGLKNVHPPVFDSELAETIAKSKINISVDLNQVSGLWSVRNSRIMACGGFVLFKYTPLSEIVFRDKVIYFDTIKDCLYKIGYYLKNDKEREYIANQAYKYAQNNFKVRNKLNTVLTAINYNTKGEQDEA
jgi:hypothetical protein